jgi:chromosome segregation ATPase
MSRTKSRRHQQAALVICPKCGFEQEDRLDCKKCGVVFAKYYALHPPDFSSSPEEAVDPAPKPEPQALTDLAELRQLLDELNRRFNELEFERIERTRMRGEMRNMEKQLQESLGQLSDRLGENEKLVANLSCLPVGPTAEEFAELKSDLSAISLEPILQNLQGLEEKTASLQESVNQTDPRILEVLRKLDDRLGVLETSKPDHTSDESSEGGSDPDTLAKALEELAEMRVSLQNVTVRYSEIGELKKNHLILLNKMESLQHNLETISREPSSRTQDRFGQIEKEVSALRAEVRQALNGFESGVASTKHDSSELEAVKAELAQIARLRMEGEERTQSALSGLESKISESSRAGAGILERIEALANYIRRIEQQLQPLSNSVEEALRTSEGLPTTIEDVQRDLTSVREDYQQVHDRLEVLENRIEGVALQISKDPQPPLHADMHAIRENLDEIRRFIANKA